MFLWTSESPYFLWRDELQVLIDKGYSQQIYGLSITDSPSIAGKLAEIVKGVYDIWDKSPYRYTMKYSDFLRKTIQDNKK